MNAHKDPFGQTPDGQDVFVYTLANSKGLRARITSFGAALVSLEIPDRDGNLADVVLGFDELSQYIEQTVYFGVTVGRYANRIGNAKFTLDGTEYQLSVNHGAHELHGGTKGFD
jgi:aldose 1-epimerase